MIEKGLVQVYTGKGKGKTTAAIGLAVRAAGRGNQVLIYQFLKPPEMETGERMAFGKSELPVEIKSLDVCWNMYRDFSDEEQMAKCRESIRGELAELTDAAASGRYDLIILDEIVFCEAKNLVDIEDIKNLVAGRADKVELVMTGREATDEMMELADLVTEMKKIKHPFDKGVNARVGIEY